MTIMRAALWALAAIAGLFASGAVALFAQPPEHTAEPGCFTAFKLAQGAGGKPLVLSTRELDELATRRAMPAPPKLGLMAARITGSVRTRILVDEAGMVKCAVVVSGHPLLTKGLAETLTQWQFRPFTAGGRPSAVLGFLDFRVSTDDPQFYRLEFDYHPPQPK